MEIMKFTRFEDQLLAGIVSIDVDAPAGICRFHGKVRSALPVGINSSFNNMANNFFLRVIIAVDAKTVNNIARMVILNRPCGRQYDTRQFPIAVVIKGVLPLVGKLHVRSDKWIEGGGASIQSRKQIPVSLDRLIRSQGVGKTRMPDLNRSRRSSKSLICDDVRRSATVRKGRPIRDGHPAVQRVCNGADAHRSVIIEAQTVAVSVAYPRDQSA